MPVNANLIAAALADKSADEESAPEDEFASMAGDLMQAAEAGDAPAFAALLKDFIRRCVEEQQAGGYEEEPGEDVDDPEED